MTKYFLCLLLLTSIISCKKKEQKTETTPDTNTTTEEATYQSNLRRYLTLTYNAGNFDTSFSFSGKYVKIVGSSQTWSSFPSTNYNGYIANSSNSFNGEVLSCPNFMKLANKSIWNVVSSEFGNFQYIDSVASPSISTNLSIIPTTFDANQGIPIKIDGIQGTSSIGLLDKSETYFYDIIKFYNYVATPSILDTIRGPELLSIPLNTNFTLSISCGVNFGEYINGHNSFMSKNTVYNYSIKRIN